MSAPPYEISIEVSEDDLRRHGMTFDQVADAVRRSSLDPPGGSVRTERARLCGQLLKETGRDCFVHVLAGGRRPADGGAGRRVGGPAPR